ncbi:hypothetical protein DAH66_06860 [Sphingomonas koreensis]|uniref:Uncharacterized protein n=1 Tax=Sphingomonas koreensis TaxID=93064 RepID=A0A2M8WHN0_9SPHN|nr:hypothetical protein [Sphingomonas koreensis]PJI90442.1 hypothetical protein BDW16_3777 [Sphingomonas koreensis]RSU61096.1 hypothetical protein DAH56_06495 [Sphingomonas koreensis]RSU69741.1 hypothetical protein DAH55_07065 [Sphingomonas koreensis]RSY87351.1 hypothetical protein DAH66_06860 [Sphingomonas koreensis]
MDEDRSRAPLRRYETTLDRVGFAFATGGTLGGVLVLLLVLAGGQADATSLMVAWALGALFVTLGIAAVAAPLWLGFHVMGWRKPWHAAALGAALAMVVFVAAQTHGFGLFDAPPSDGRVALFRWLSATATSALIALAAAGIALAMWRVAYRPAD